jgi:hypothetical protein
MLWSFELWHFPLCTWIPSFRRNILPPSSGQRCKRIECTRRGGQCDYVACRKQNNSACFCVARLISVYFMCLHILCGAGCATNRRQLPGRLDFVRRRPISFRTIIAVFLPYVQKCVSVHMHRAVSLR